MEQVWTLPNIPVNLNIVAVFLTPATKDERDAVLGDLEKARGTPSYPEFPDASKYPLRHIPWIRRSLPATAQAIQEIMCSQQGLQCLIVVDRQTMLERAQNGVQGTAVAVVWNERIGVGESWKRDMRAVRVQLDRAHSLIASVIASQWKKSLPDLMPDYEDCKLDLSGVRDFLTLPQPGEKRSLAQTSHDDGDYIYILPAHLPSDLTLSYETPTFISLVHLEQAEIEDLKSTIKESETNLPEDAPPIQDIQILNWPANQQPCSREEMYRIFQAIRTPSPDRADETLAFFIDKENYPLDPEEPPGIIVATSRRNKEAYTQKQRRSHETGMEVDQMSPPEDILKLWHSVFYPPKPADRQHVGVRYRTCYSKERVSDPERPTCGDTGTSWYIFLLCPMTEAQIRRIRDWATRHVEQDCVQFVNVAKHLRTPDLASLLHLFKSDEFKNYSDMPMDFVAIDEEAVDDEYMCIVASSITKSHRCEGGQEVGYDYVGFEWERGSYEAAADAHVQLSVANMHFDEMFGDPERIYWSDVDEELVGSDSE
ncbi:hypothetical protein F4778DRAFT_24797 [Xylariomycetidae sp. FL2044]|nr:hypothetical protein F4778DRAFT_24797 [Xylariomycetidae sp. FL2044]